MKKELLASALALVAAVTAYTRGPAVLAAPGDINCSLSGYKNAAGLSAVVAGDALTLTWDGERNQEMRMRLGIAAGTPTIQELTVRKKGGAWGTLATNVTPEYRVASGIRRIDREAEEGLKENGINEITPDVYEKYQWDPFWDAPLNVPGAGDTGRTTGLPRKPEEVHRGSAEYKASACEVKTDGSHLSVSFPNSASVGVFTG